MPDNDEKSINLMWPQWMDNQPLWQPVDIQTYIREGFSMNSLIYSCIMYKARAIQLAPLRAYVGDPQQPEYAAPGHPLSKLAARPNPFQSWVEFAGLNVSYLNASGNCYIYLDRKKRGGVPEQMISLRPDRVKIIPENGKAIGFLYCPNENDIDNGLPILPEDLIHVKLPNPLDPLEGMGYGLSPIAPAAQSANVDNYVTKFLDIFFRQGTNIGAVARFKNKLTDDQVSRIQTRWQEIYGGVENWAKRIMVLDQDGQFDRVLPTFDEMGFETIDARNESRIAMPFGVPLELLGSRLGMSKSTYNNKAEARRTFWEDTFSYEITLFGVDYGYYLDGDGVYVSHDLTRVPALQPNMTELIDGITKLWNVGVPFNTAAQTVGLRIEPIPGGDIGYLPMSVAPVGEDGMLILPEPAVVEEPGAFGDEDEPDEEPTDEEVAEAEERLKLKKKADASPVLPRMNGKKPVTQPIPNGLHKLPTRGKIATANKPKSNSKPTNVPS